MSQASTQVNFTAAKLSAASLMLADLGGTNFTEARMSGTELTQAELDNPVFATVDLRKVIGLSSCRHYGPSTLDHRTLMQSGPLPLEFLRGCGLPDSLIEYLPSLLGAGPIQLYSCFISYSTQDQDFAD